MRKLQLKYLDQFHDLIFLKEVTAKVENSGNKIRTGLFKCKCGVEKEMPISRIMGGKIKSCGCITKETIKIAHSVNLKHGLSGHPLYMVWFTMKKRCFNPSDVGYDRYGGRGITVYDKWINDFPLFYKWAIKKGWQKHLQIDRKNNNKNYTPWNCRFVTRKENANNTSRNIFVDYNGEKLTLAIACDKAGVKNKYDLILHKINKTTLSFDEIVKQYK